MRVALGIPFRSKDTSRISAYRQTLEALMEFEPPFAKVLISTDDAFEGEFNRGRARNNLVERLSDHDVIVLCDADSIPEFGPLRRAILAAAFDGKIHIPFNRVNVMDKLGRLQHSYGPSAGGCFVFRPDAWKRMGWMDERGGWSLDDRSFLVQMNTLSTGPVFHEGSLTALWHARGPETKVTPYVASLIDDYLALEGREADLREYLSKRNKDQGRPW